MQRTRLHVGDETLRVMVASRRADLRHGLKGVRRLPPSVDGLLMIFPHQEPQLLTMAGVLMDLDAYAMIATERASGIVVGCLAMAAGVPGPYEIPPCRLVLEVPAGAIYAPDGSSWAIG